jgi:hypothetical protein
MRYTADDLDRLSELAEGPLTAPKDIRRVIDRLGYYRQWRTRYRVQSVRASLRSRVVTCIDAAILSYGLLELLFVDFKRRLLALHRRDPAGEECGHVVTLYWDDDGRVGAFSKSSFSGLGHRDAVYEDADAVAASYAEAYLAMGFTPLYYGITTLDAIAGTIDWRCGEEPLNELSDRLQDRYQFAFLLAR